MNLLRILTVPPIAVLSALWLTATSAAQITFSDGDFSGWASQTVSGAPGGQVSTVISTDGNPDAFFSVTTTTNESTTTGHFKPAFVYDPALGAVNSIQGSLDFRNFNSFGEGHGVAVILLEQDGSFYQSPGFITESAIFTWQSRIPVIFNAADFPAGLDFSTSGAPITVGFQTANSGGSTINVGYDNFLAVLDVTPVPVPAPVLLLGSALACLNWSRTRRSNQPEV